MIARPPPQPPCESRTESIDGVYDPRALLDRGFQGANPDRAPRATSGESRTSSIGDARGNGHPPIPASGRTHDPWSRRKSPAGWDEIRPRHDNEHEEPTFRRSPKRSTLSPVVWIKGRPCEPENE